MRPANTEFASFDTPLTWGELLKRTAKETSDDECLGLAAQLAYYFFLALFPAILVLIAFASFFLWPVVVSFTLFLAGPSIAEHLASTFELGPI